MKCTLLIVLACFAMIAESHPYLGLDAAAGIGQGLGNAIANTLTLGLGTVANIGTGAIGLGVGIVDAIAKGVESGLGMRGSAQSAFGNVQQGTTQEGETQNDSDEANAYNQKSHKKSKKNYHDSARHHTIVTTITRVEKSDEHDVGNNETVEESAQEAGASKKQTSAAPNDYRSNYRGDSQEQEEN